MKTNKKIMIIKRILLSLILTISIILINKVSIASANDIDNNSQTVQLNYSDLNAMTIGENHNKYAIYCVQRHANLGNGAYTYTKAKRIFINGNDAYAWDYNSIIPNSVIGNDANAVLAYILGGESYNSGYHDGVRQNALWKYINTWFNEVGNQLNIDFAWSMNDGDANNSDAEALLNKAKDYAKYGGYSAAISIKDAEAYSDRIFFKIEKSLNTTITSVKVKIYNQNGIYVETKNLSTHSSSYQMTSGCHEGYKYKIEVEGKATIPNVTIWLLKNPSVQNLIAVKVGQEEVTSSESITIQDKYGTISVKKIDGVSEQVLQGAKFKIKKRNGQFIFKDNNTTNVFETGNRGTESIRVQLPNTGTDTYDFYEVEAPTGYNLSEQDGYVYQPLGSSMPEGYVYSGYATVSHDGTIKYYDRDGNRQNEGALIVENLKSGKLTINKVDKDNPYIVIQGAEFEIINYNNEKLKALQVFDGQYIFIGFGNTDVGTSTFTTNSGGQVFISGLPLKRQLTIYETKGTDEYPIDADSRYVNQSRLGKKAIYVDDVTLNKDNGGIATVTCENKKAGKIRIEKYDGDSTSTALSAGVAIYRSGYGWLKGSQGSYDYNSTYNASQNKYTVPASGRTLEGIIPGTYEIYEVEAPSGYELSQQYGAYQKSGVGWVVNLGSKSVSGGQTATWKGYNYKRGKLTITKKDKDNSSTSLKAGFKIYVKNGSTALGWLKHPSYPSVITNSCPNPDNGTNVYTYTASYDNATTFYTDADSNGVITIQRLKYYTYYIYEVEAPSEYNLSQQTKYKSTSDPNGFAQSKPIVYCGSREIKSDSRLVTWGETNKKRGTMELTKVDSIYTSTKLKGAEYKIYYVDASGNKKGWLSSVSSGEYGTTATMSSAKKFSSGYGYGTLSEATNGTSITDKTITTIKHLKYGTYYIYEVTDPTGKDGTSYDSQMYDMSRQRNYNTKASALSSGVDHSGNYVYIKSVTINGGGTRASNAIQTSNTPNTSRANLTIHKYDGDNTNTKIRAGFKIYAILDERDSSGKRIEGWLSGNANGAAATNITENNTYKYTNTKANATIYYTNQSTGQITLNRLKFGTYRVYEVDIPAGANNDYFKLEYQDGYDATNKWIDCGTAVVTDNKSQAGSAISNQYLKDANKNKGFDGDTFSGTVTFRHVNYKYIAISGYVWNDKIVEIKDSPGDGNNQFDNNENKIDGVTVELVKKGSDDTYVLTQNTGGTNHEYKFEKIVSSDTNSNMGVRYVKINTLKDYYVRFKYKKPGTVEDEYKYYIPVAFNSTVANSIIPNGSRAVMDDVAKKDIDLNGIATTYTGNTSGVETTYGLSGNLFNKLYDYNHKHNSTTYKKPSYTLEYINLGIKKLPDTDYTITENIAEVRISMKGYTYTYNYAGKGITEAVNAPTVNFQNRTLQGYTREFYPADIAYDKINNTQDLKVEVEYRIDITNTTNWNLPYLYQEQKMYIKTITDRFDTDRYVLKDNNWTVSGDTATIKEEYLKEKFGYEETRYNPSDEGDHDGLGKNETRTAFITFSVKHDAIMAMLENLAGVAENQNAPTKATATAYHKYTRNDYSWTNLSTNTSANNNKGLEKEQTHYTIDDTRSNEAPYLIFKLKESTNRTIHGTVFEDGVENAGMAIDREGLGNTTISGEALGNGKKDSGEKPVSGVLVELLDVTVGDANLDGQISAADMTKELKLIARIDRIQSDEQLKQADVNSSSDTDWEDYYMIQDHVAKTGRKLLEYSGVTKLYGIDTTKSPAQSVESYAYTLTDENGNYSFEGVVPGEYYLRYTYGDGTQKIYNSEGEEITWQEEEKPLESKVVGGDNATPDKYKSTIITDKVTKDVLQGKETEGLTYKKSDFVSIRTGNFKANNKKDYIWYKHIGELDDPQENYLENTYSVAIDNMDSRKTANDEYDENNKEATAHANVSASTSRLSITVENTRSEDKQIRPVYALDGKTIVDTIEESTQKFGELNFGIIRQARPELAIEDVITNVRLVNAQGNTVINGNPETDKGTMQGVTDLDNIKNGGSSYTRVELETDKITGDTLEVTYGIRVTNVSEINYYGENYYYYGDPKDCHEVTLKADNVYDYLDKSFAFDEKQLTSQDNIHKFEIEKIGNNVSGIIKQKDKDYKEWIGWRINISGWRDNLYTNRMGETQRGAKQNEIKISETATFAATRLLSGQEDDWLFKNSAVVMSARNKPEEDPYDTDEEDVKEENIRMIVPASIPERMDTAIITIMPPTGYDIQSIIFYITAGIIALAIMFIGIIIIKRKVTKKE